MGERGKWRQAVSVLCRYVRHVSLHQCCNRRFANTYNIDQRVIFRKPILLHIAGDRSAKGKKEPADRSLTIQEAAAFTGSGMSFLLLLEKETEEDNCLITGKTLRELV